ncbi:hypothetical protein [Clostridium polynesiense]|uniref:hypothetical protein n=1 Tax=Clostridium polynesiense TaxID=1325933 RepID=UPI00058FD202|nr:hypothetical protein [Clostridium polynesiense]
MNCEIRILKNISLDVVISNSVLSILNSNKGVMLSSNQILLLLPRNLQIILNNIASSYSKGPCSKPAAYVGSIASDLSNNIRNVVHNYKYYCPILKRKDDAFKFI